MKARCFVCSAPGRGQRRGWGWLYLVTCFIMESFIRNLREMNVLRSACSETSISINLYLISSKDAEF